MIILIIILQFLKVLATIFKLFFYIFYWCLVERVFSDVLLLQSNTVASWL